VGKAFNNTRRCFCKSGDGRKRMLAECDRDMMLAYAGKVKVAGSRLCWIAELHKVPKPREIISRTVGTITVVSV